MSATVIEHEILKKYNLLIGLISGYAAPNARGAFKELPPDYEQSSGS